MDKQEKHEVITKSSCSFLPITHIPFLIYLLEKGFQYIPMLILNSWFLFLNIQRVGIISLHPNIGLLVVKMSFFLVLPPITFYFFLFLIFGAYCHSLGKIFIVFSRPTQVLAIVLLVVKIFNWYFKSFWDSHGAF